MEIELRGPTALAVTRYWIEGAVAWESVGRVRSDPSSVRAPVESVDAQVLALPPQVPAVSQLGTEHMRWMRKDTTLPPASGLPLFSRPASVQLAESYQSGSLTA